MTTFQSVLFRNQGLAERQVPVADFFADLHLDQVVGAIVAGKEEYALEAFFQAPLHTVDEVDFRHEVMRDLESPTTFDLIQRFAERMRQVRAHMGQLQKRYYALQKDRWLLDAVDTYCHAIKEFETALLGTDLRSRGLLGLRDYLIDYVSSLTFTMLITQTERLTARLADIRYNVVIKGARVEVRPFIEDADYGAEVERTFKRFAQGNGEEFGFHFDDGPEMNHIEARILEGVAALNPSLFAELATFASTYSSFMEPVIATFDREIQFYVAYLEYRAAFVHAGLPFCYPRTSARQKEVHARQAFDLALARKLIKEGAAPVCNDFALDGPERIIVVSGPNQGGKTTFARMFGQMHYLASLGCPVPGEAAQLYLPNCIKTHFERQEQMSSHRGKLEDDLIRIHDILKAATPQTLVIINEIFSSTALHDALTLSREIASALINLDVLGVWVTFIDEIATLDAKTVSMVSTVVRDNPAERTFRIVRQPADGLAYAMSIAEKYRLTYASIKKRLAA